MRPPVLTRADRINFRRCRYLLDDAMRAAPARHARRVRRATDGGGNNNFLSTSAPTNLRLETAAGRTDVRTDGRPKYVCVIYSERTTRGGAVLRQLYRARERASTRFLRRRAGRLYLLRRLFSVVMAAVVMTTGNGEQACESEV